MATGDSDEFRRQLDEIVEQLEHWRVRARMSDSAEKQEHRLDAMNSSHAVLLEAINANMKATNELLRTAAEIGEGTFVREHTAFEATQDVLDEGEYLYRVLATGPQGTEGSRDATLGVRIELRITVLDGAAI